MIGDIFSGEVVAEVDLTRNVFDNAWDRREWGVGILESYVRKIHGSEIIAHDNGNASGRLTGIKAFVYQGVKDLTYALIEPKNRWNKKVLITCAESNRDECHVCSGEVVYPTQQEQGGFGTTLGNAFARASIDPNQLKERLPSESDILIVEVNRHPKTKEPSVAPQYMESDPLFDGKKTMRIFHVVSSTGELRVGQKWRCQKTQDKPVEAGKKKGEISMIHINVEMLRKIA